MFSFYYYCYLRAGKKFAPCRLRQGNHERIMCGGVGNSGMQNRQFFNSIKFSLSFLFVNLLDNFINF
jgi:hypothetical protein